MALFPCTKCGCIETTCVRTKTKTGETVRHRRCVLCGHVMETKETISNSNPSMKKRSGKSANKSDEFSTEELQKAVKKAMAGEK